MANNILVNIDGEITEIRNNVLAHLDNEQYWRNQYTLAIRKCMRLNEELKNEKYLHGLTKSCRKLSIIDGLCDDIIQKIIDHLGIYGALLLRTCKKLNNFSLKLKTSNLNSPIFINIDHLIKNCEIYSCFNKKFQISYVGECVAAMPHGKGKIMFTSNKFIKGELSGTFNKGVPIGKHVISEEESVINIGSLVHFMLWSTIKFDNGVIDYSHNCSIKSDYNRSFYTGSFTLDNAFSNIIKSIIYKSGKGTEIIGKDCYNGNWHLNRYHGLGNFIVNDKIKYSGYWSGGLPFCPEISMYGDINMSILENKTIIIGEQRHNYDMLTLNENKMIAYNKIFDIKLDRVVVKKIGVLVQNQNNLWEWGN